jgi:hypothetical protein
MRSDDIAATDIAPSLARSRAEVSDMEAVLEADVEADLEADLLTNHGITARRMLECRHGRTLGPAGR